MDLTRWKRISPLLDELLELDAERRRAELARLRAEDPGLADELERLLALESEHEDFLSAPAMSQPRGPASGDLIGPYRLLNLLGEGGMGLVWLAERADGLYRRRVALKLLRPGLANPDLRLRFSREREILAQLQHPHIARLLDAGIGSEGQPYLALEYVEGEPITEYAKRHALDVEQRLRLFLQVCDAVSHAHANLIVHRDLKPSNILVTPGGDVRLLDFGIAKLLHSEEPSPPDARTEARTFTLHYAAPEQVRGEPVTTMTDVYSLGVVLCEALAESRPYRLRRQGDAEWERVILEVEPMGPSAAVMHGEDDTRPRKQLRKLSRRLSGDLDNIVLRALAKKPEQRYPSVEAMATDIDRHLHGRPVLARPQGFLYHARKYLGRHRWAVTLGSLVAAVLVTAVVVSVLQARQAERETARAQAMQSFVLGLFNSANGDLSGDRFDIRTMLDAGERRGERELARQPLAQAELLGTIAQLRIGLGDYGRAQTLLDRQRQLLADADSVPPALRLQAATQQGQIAWLLDDSRRCLEAMLPAQALADELQGRSGLAVATYLAQLGRCQRGAGERLQARRLFLRALEIHREAGDIAGRAENMGDLATLDAEMNRIDDAVTLLRNALALLHDGVGDRHPLNIDLQRQLGRLYRERGDTELALAAYTHALALSEDINGPLHPMTLTVRRQEAAVLIDQGRFNAAAEQLRQLHDLTVRSLGPNHRESGLSWNSLGVIAWERGQYDEAIADISRAVAIWRNADGAQQLPGGLYNLGMVLHSAGRDVAALAALAESRSLRAAQYGASSVMVGDTDRLIGEIQMAQGRMDAAATSLGNARALARIGYPESHPRRLDAELSMAHYLARSGQVAQALPILDTLAKNPGKGSEGPKLRWRARAYAAEARCATGQAARGRSDLDALLAELHRQQPDGGVIPREVQSIRDACSP